MGKAITIGELINKKDYDYIKLIAKLPESAGGDKMFWGAAASKNGKLISLDGDSYSEETEVLSYKE